MNQIGPAAARGNMQCCDPPELAYIGIRLGNQRLQDAPCLDVITLMDRTPELGLVLTTQMWW